jgi:hypothetical protein
VVLTRLTEQQKVQWHTEGYLHVKGALSREQAGHYLSSADDVIDLYLREQPEAREQRAFTIVNTIERSSAFNSLLDHRGAFGIILDLMGPYIQVMGTQVYVRHPNMNPLMSWHTDAGPSLQRIRIEPDSPPLNLKIQYFLTDIPELDRANFCLVPGSHRELYPEDGFPEGHQPPGAIQICAEVGDAVLFPHSLWHAVAPHHGKDVRRSLTFRYGQMWCRPYDYEKILPSTLQGMTTRQRRLMGDMGPDYLPTDYYKPQDQLEKILTGLDW